MSANIAQFRARQKPGWWDGQGIYTFEEDASPLVSVAMKEAGMDFEFIKTPNFVEIDGEKIPTGYYTVIRPPVEGFIGEQLEIDTDDDGSGYHIFQSNVSEDFEMIQNMELAEILDPIAKEWPVETVGSLRHGERTFVLLRAGEHKVKGHDLLKTYFAVMDDKTGGMNITIMPTDVRIVCMNTLNASLRRSDLKIKIGHNRGAKDDVDVAVRLMKEARENKERVLEMYDVMAGRKATDEEARAVVNAALPMPNWSGNAQIGRMLEENGTTADDLGLSANQLDRAMSAYERVEYVRERTERQRDECFERIEAFNDATPELARTYWAAYNAVTDYADWNNASRLTANSILMGGRAKMKSRAFDHIADVLSN